MLGLRVACLTSMPEVDVHVARLGHRDVRQRRRALRRLVDLDDPRAVAAMVLLLDDEDAWFRTKALDLVQRWAARLEPADRAVLVSHGRAEVRRVAAALLPPDGSWAGPWLTLLGDEDPRVRLAAARAASQQASSDAWLAPALADPDHRIRLAAAGALTQTDPAHETHLVAALRDTHPAVSRAASSAIDPATASPTLIAALAELAERPGTSGTAALAASLTSLGPTVDTDTTLHALAARPGPEAATALRAALGADPAHLEDAILRQTLIGAGHAAVLISAAAQRATSLKLLMWILSDPAVPELQRARLLDRLHARPLDSALQPTLEDLASGPSPVLARAAAALLATLPEEAAP